MKYTGNYNLKKPEGSDVVNIDDLNGNADTVDAELRKAEDHRESTANPHKVMADQVGAINPNLLINGDFQVWQRGTEFSGKVFGQYTADRWLVVSNNGNSTTTVTKADNGLKATQSVPYAACVVRYRMEEKDLKNIRGKTVTLSYSRDNTIYTKTYTVSNDLTERDSVFSEISLPNGSTLNWVKLEFGSVATDFSPRPYAAELAMCQRYYQLCDVTGYGFVISETTASAHYPLTTTMRTTPTILSSNICAIRTSEEIVESATLSVHGMFDSSLWLYATAVDTTMTVHRPCMISAGDTDLILDAEIY
ncbi:MAG: hypothetical protein ACFWUC_13150 [Oscillospiraceae bacterium]